MKVFKVKLTYTKSAITMRVIKKGLTCVEFNWSCSWHQHSPVRQRLLDLRQSSPKRWESQHRKFRQKVKSLFPAVISISALSRHWNACRVWQACTLFGWNKSKRFVCCLWEFYPALVYESHRCTLLSLLNLLLDTNAFSAEKYFTAIITNMTVKSNARLPLWNSPLGCLRFV